MGRFVDSIIAYRILRMLTTPFENTDAYQLGIIDIKGKELKKMSSLNSVNERDAYSILHRMIFRIKRIIEKVPVDNKKLITFAAALSLVKEHAGATREPIDLESQFMDRLDFDLQKEIQITEEFLGNTNMFTFKQFVEEAPANNAAATPGVAGFTPDTLGVPKSTRPPLLKRKKVIKNV